jgi:cyclopropane fatty-acyl-phospholipid synthase-like methyltransferase
MPTFTALHHDLTFFTPLSENRADRLVAFLAGDQPSSGPEMVLDVGCGWGELLLRVLEAAPAARGLGVDLDEESLAGAREHAVRRGLAERATFEGRDAREITGTYDAVTCIGASQIWGPDVAEAQPLDYAAALEALRGLLSRGGRLVYGEGIWSRPPTPAATAPLAGRDDEFVPIGRLVELAKSQGFAVLAAHEASLDEWDVFESGYAAGYGRWLAEHQPDDTDAEEVRRLAARQHAAYFDGYRGVMGLAYLHLLAV